MLASLRNSVLSLVRDKALLVWVLAFPIIMTCIFMGMFSGIEDAYTAVGSTLGVVRDESYTAAIGLDETIQAISDASSDQHICDVTYYESAAEAKAAADAGEVDAYLTVDGEGTPRLNVTHAGIAENGSLPTSFLVEVLDFYLHARNAVEKVAVTRPELLATGDAQSAFTGNAVQTVQLSATKNPPSADARYYYALLAMAAGMGATAAMESVRRLLPTAGPLGARQTLAAVPRWRMLVGALLGAWLCQLACLLAATLFMWGVAGVPFGDNVPGVVGALAASSLMACAAGALCGTVTHMETGMISGITCLLSLFTGLYGTASQQLADSIEATAPALAHANPLWQTTNCFYSLLYYDTPSAFLESFVALLIMALVFLALASMRMRRTSYDHL